MNRIIAVDDAIHLEQVIHKKSGRKYLNWLLLATPA